MIEYRIVSPATGRLLIADPFLRDENFKRSVVLLASYSEEGVVGFVLNHPSQYRIGDLLPDLENSFGFNPTVYLGGPVQLETLHFIHRLGDEIADSLKIGDNLWWGGNLDSLAAMVGKNQVDEKDVRFFIGYSGWGYDQLDGEIEERTWIVADGTEQLVFQKEQENDFWKTAVNRLGNPYSQLLNYPEDVQWN